MPQHYQVQEGHDTPTCEDGTTSLEDREQDGMSTHDGGNDSSAGSAGQEQAQVHTKDDSMSTHDGGNDSSARSAGQQQAQVHTKDKFAEEPAGRRGTIGEHTKRSQLLFR